MSDEKKPLYASDASYAKALVEIEDRLKKGVKVVAEDDTTPGNKSTHCNIGLCAKDIEKDGTYWQHNTSVEGLGKRRHACPHDRRFFGPDGGPPVREYSPAEMGSGCFWTCRIFRGAEVETREQRIARTRAALKKALDL